VRWLFSVAGDLSVYEMCSVLSNNLQMLYNSPCLDLNLGPPEYEANGSVMTFCLEVTILALLKKAVFQIRNPNSLIQNIDKLCFWGVQGLIILNRKGT
jgi:hypothetical protein